MLDDVDNAQNAPNTNHYGKEYMSSGANQGDARAHNDRLILNILRKHGPHSKAELSRLTGLSAQTLSLIMKRLKQNHLVMPGNPIRGGIGQPSTPYQLSPRGAFSFGLKIGRRSVELVLVDFLGMIIQQTQMLYSFPNPKETLSFVELNVKKMLNNLSEDEKKRMIGIGLAMPFEIWKWTEQINATNQNLDQWRHFDLVNMLQNTFGFNAMLINDASAACAAELVQSSGPQYPDYLYFYIGWFLGGGITLNGKVYTGKHGNAAALGTMLIAMDCNENSKKVHQLLDLASIYLLENSLTEIGIDPLTLWHESENWNGFDLQLNTWINQTAKAIAIAIVNSCAVIDFDTVFIDGAFPNPIRTRLCQQTRNEFNLLDRRGIQDVQILEGSAGRQARALGAAMIPILKQYGLEESLGNNSL